MQRYEEKSRPKISETLGLNQASRIGTLKGEGLDFSVIIAVSHLLIILDEAKTGISGRNYIYKLYLSINHIYL